MNKAQNLSKAKEIFGKHSGEDVLHFTSDGQPFFKPHDANHHAKSLEDKKVMKIERDALEATNETADFIEPENKGLNGDVMVTDTGAAGDLTPNNDATKRQEDSETGSVVIGATAADAAKEKAKLAEAKNKTEASKPKSAAKKPEAKQESKPAANQKKATEKAKETGAEMDHKKD